MLYAILAYNSFVHSFTKCRRYDIIKGYLDPRDRTDVDKKICCNNIHRINIASLRQNTIPTAGGF